MSLKGAPVLVTGGTGFIGSHLVEYLLKEGANISIISKERIKLENNINVFTGNLSDPEFTNRVVKEVKPRKIFHLGAFVNPSRDFGMLNKIYKNNFYGTVNLLQSLLGTSYESFVFTSTAEVYGNNKVPFKEDMQLNPLSPYSLSKASAEMICNMFYQIYKNPIIILRLFLVYGPGQKPDRFVPQLITTLLNNKKFVMTKGEQKRDFVFVEDVAEALIKASLSREAQGQTINICTGKPNSIKEIADNVSDMINAKNLIDYSKPYRENEQWDYYGDLGKARKILRWEPRTNIEDGLKKTIDWYKKHI